MGIALPENSKKLYSGSRDGTIRVWDCDTGLCVHVNDLGTEVGSLICRGIWVFVGMTNVVKVSSKLSIFYFCFLFLLLLPLLCCH